MSRMCYERTSFIGWLSFLFVIRCNHAFQVIHESDNILAIHKPPGVPHHSSVSDGELGVMALLRQQREETNERLYSVHRLDRVTSGILLFAKNRETASSLSSAFREGKVMKYYTALSFHKPKQKKQGWIQGGMQRGRRKSWMLTRDSSENFAKTRFFSAGLGQLDADGEAPKTLLLMRPYTGKTHQLRVAAKSVGLPIAGDPIYRDRFSHEVGRTYLHATAIQIRPDHGTNLEELCIWCPPPFCSMWSEPCGFQEVLQRLVMKHCDSNEIKAICSNEMVGASVARPEVI